MLSLRRLAPALLALAACGDNDGSSPIDAPRADAPAPLDAPADAAPLPDSPPPDAADGLPSTCSGTCATTALTATFGNTTRVLNVAYYGLTVSGGSTTIRVEAYRGADPGCPTQTSGTPDQALILVAVPIPTSTDPLTTNATLLDFEGALVSTTSARATAVSLTPTAASLCPTCVGMPSPSDPDGLLAVDTSLTFPTGTITGHLFARHCDSLDLIE